MLAEQNPTIGAGMEPSTRGRFIVLEGIDGSGTTSQCRALAAALEAQSGDAVLQTHQPSSGPIGRLIRARLAADAAPLDPAAMALLFAADRLDHLRTEIEPALAAGHDVVCDRYLMSSWTYQALDSPMAWVQTINAAAPWPDLTILLEVPVAVAQARIAARAAAEGVAEEIYDREPLQRQIADGYAALLAVSRPGVHRVDGTRSPEAVTAACVEICARHPVAR